MLLSRGFLCNKRLVFFSEMAILGRISTQYCVIVFMVCLVLINLPPALIGTRRLNSGSVCRYRCQGEYKLCLTQVTSPEGHMICVLAKDLCREHCKTQRYRRPPLYDKNISMLVLSYWQSMMKKAKKAIV